MGIAKLFLLSATGAPMLAIGWHVWRVYEKPVGIAFGVFGSALLTIAALAAWGGV